MLSAKLAAPQPILPNCEAVEISPCKAARTLILRSLVATDGFAEDLDHVHDLHDVIRVVLSLELHESVALVACPN